MKFLSFKKFESAGNTLERVLNFLKVDLEQNLTDLFTGLKRLNFTDNFESFEATVIIPPGQEVGIENKLRGGIPTGRLILRSNVAEIMDGDTLWSKQYVYLKNTGASEATVTVVFMK